MIKVFITNLAKYNEGYLIGDWVSLPLPPEDLDEIIATILGDDEEFFITDYETELYLDIDEYSDPYDLNDLVEEIDALNEYELKTLKAILEWGVYRDIRKAIDNLDRFSLREDIQNESDLAYEYIDNCENVSEFVGRYIDYNKLGRDLAMDGYISEYGYIEEC